VKVGGREGEKGDDLLVTGTGINRVQRRSNLMKSEVVTGEKKTNVSKAKYLLHVANQKNRGD